LPPRSAITAQNAAKIEDGMTLAEVEAILGGPARNDSDLPDNFINDAFVVRNLRGRPPSAEKRWATNISVVVVHFDDAGRVIQQVHFAYDMERSPWDKLRHWLGL
jgi:hypothetical protein